MPLSRRTLIIVSIFLIILIGLATLLYLSSLEPSDYTYSQINWSPDGKYVAFITTANAMTSGIDIFSVQDMKFVNSGIGASPGVFPPHFSWSPDSQSVAFVSYQGIHDGIYRANIDGSNLENLTDDVLLPRNPDWSPDGRRIAFDIFSGQVYIVNVDGANLVRLTSRNEDAGIPAWSPDGRFIAYQVHEGSGSAVYIMNADGSNYTRLADFRDVGSDLIWSPDGNKIILVSEEATRFYVVDTIQPQIITQVIENDSLLPIVWSPDSTRIAYMTAEGLVVKNIQTDTLKQISSDVVDNLFWKTPGQILSLDMLNRRVLTFPVND
ncbi:MAG: PD40 domain-containing protein [Anaerolineaceae bacterium]|nr:PD40 domain-containing protein [Anaerolineaceae bacterium]